MSTPPDSLPAPVPGSRGGAPAAGSRAADLFFNRELSWIEFNRRVLEEARETDQPLLERVKFTSIFASNLDEFFMIRVSGLRQQLQAGVTVPTADGRTPLAQLTAIRDKLEPMLETLATSWSEELLPALAEAGIRIRTWEQLDDGQRRELRDLFEREIFATLTPLAFDPGHPFPHISNLSMNLAILVREPGGGERFARVKVPGFYPRLLRVSCEEEGAATVDGAHPAGRTVDLVWMEDVVAANLDLLFPGHEIEAAYPFRVTRDADQEIEADEAGDLLTMIQENLRLRHFGSAVRLELTPETPDSLRRVLVENLGLQPYQVYAASGRLGLADVMELVELDRPDLKYEPFTPALPAAQERRGDVFATIRERDLLLYHPYDSFVPVIEFLRAAARDPDVLAIKQTLYRVGPDSPIVDALMEARANGKQVATLVELKARFDEANNIVWARALEDAGVHVVYGVMGLKTHAKLCLVVRREPGGIARYVHVSTGNYNIATARVYTDIGCFTADPGICAEAAALFNSLTGYSRGDDYEHLLVAPGNLRSGILDRIEREITRHARHGDGYLAFKMNSLVDDECIRALYRASCAGVRVELQVRGICCLRPGVPGLSENIRVTSVVGRFLEHSRLYYFRNGGDGADELFIGSADLMPRNLDHRVEVLFPVRDPARKRAVRERILRTHLQDTANARVLRADGSYGSVSAESGNPLDSQQWMIDNQGCWRE